jgi:uncharacterized membrane protein
MRIRSLIIACVLCAMLVLAMPLYKAHAQGYAQYKVQVNVDGSSAWTITQASDLNGTIDTWQGFLQRVTTLINAAAEQTHREMSLDNNSLQMNTIWETQSQTTEYQFTWLNFSNIQGIQISFGDVFHFGNFFSQLYGDGELQIVYPSGYVVQSVSPQPNGGDVDPQTLDWLGTNYLGNLSVVLKLSLSTPSPTPNQTTDNISWQVYVEVGAIVAAAAASIVGFFVVKRLKLKSNGNTKQIPQIELPKVESEEEKIIKVIQDSGGNAYQSAITEKCRFSKAKTSQLLTALEAKGVVTRYKKGRDKIVTLNKQVQRETN